jgi:hypothetical protein
MASKEEIKARVLQYYSDLYPGSTAKTTYKSIGRKPQQVGDDGEELAIELNCDPDRTDIWACKTIGDLINLLINTRKPSKGIQHELAAIGLRASRVLYPKE